MLIWIITTGLVLGIVNYYDYITYLVFSSNLNLTGKFKTLKTTHFLDIYLSPSSEVSQKSKLWNF